MFDYKKFAMVLGIMILLPLFLGLFVDAVYEEPKYEDYCNESQYLYMEKPMPSPPTVNCSYDYYSTPEAQSCSYDRGLPRFKYNASGCQVYDFCDYCNKNYQDAQELYNRNLFFLLAPLGFIAVIIGIYFLIDYMGAGLMLGGLITIFYATMRYFSDMSKLMRALIILAELILIIWIGYARIEKNRSAMTGKKLSNKKKR